MSNMILLRPLPIAAVAASAGLFAPGPGSGVANLLTPEPKEIYTNAGGGGVRNLDFDFGSVVSFDTIFLGFWDLAGAPGLDQFTGGAGYTATDYLGSVSLSSLALSSSPAPLRKHWLIRTAAPINERYIRLGITSGNTNPWSFGIAAFGLPLTTTYNREKGGGRSIVDTGAKEGRQDGGFGIGHGTRKGAFRWVWGDLSDAELDAIYDLGLAVGETSPVVVVEDPDATTGLNERIHYATFDRFEAYERGDPTKHRWALSVTQWV
jgi:hypothetical protein